MGNTCCGQSPDENSMAMMKPQMLRRQSSVDAIVIEEDPTGEGAGGEDLWEAQKGGGKFSGAMNPMVERDLEPIYAQNW